MTKMKFLIKGTHCKSCKMLIEDVLEDLNVEIVSLDMDTAKKEANLVVDSSVSADKIISELESEGEDYVVKKLK